MSDPLLAVEDLRTHFHTDDGVIRAVDGASFDVERGETVALVGESGSGKTVTCESITGLVPSPPAEVSGEVRLEGRGLLSLGERGLRSIRGDRIAHVFQNARGALDPVCPVADQIAETIAFNRDASDRLARERAIELLERVGIPRARERADDYPHEFSDGMCQRVAIAIALAGEPDLLLADEPTSALDVTIQARIVDLLASLRDDRDLSLLLVTHDLRVVAALADRVVVLYDGVVVERGPVEDVFERPGHPYTQALFRSFETDGRRREEFGHSSGRRADASPPSGCRFRRECPHAIDACAGDRPAFEPVAGRDDHRAACVYHGPEHDASAVLAESTEAGIGRGSHDDG